jgi:hypothetical protein
MKTTCKPEMGKNTIANIYISKYSPKEAKKRSCLDCDFYIVDISKIIRDLGYEIDDLTSESEFILNYTIRKKIIHGIYSTKCDSILVCYRNATPEFVENLDNFLGELSGSVEYTIHEL